MNVRLLDCRGGGYSHWMQYAYARTAKVHFWHISTPLRVGFSSSVPLRVGFFTPKRVPERVWFWQSLRQKGSRELYFALLSQTFQNYHPVGTIFDGFCGSKGMNFGQNSVPVRVGVHKICANEGRGSAAPS